MRFAGVKLKTKTSIEFRNGSKKIEREKRATVSKESKINLTLQPRNDDKNPAPLHIVSWFRETPLPQLQPVNTGFPSTFPEFSLHQENL